MSAADQPASVSGAAEGVPSAADGETVSAGAMHLAGGSHADLFGQPAMLFLDAGGSGSGGSGLRVDFVDLSSANGLYDPAAAGAGPISFDPWPAGGETVGAAAAHATEFGAAVNYAYASMLAEFPAGQGAGLPGGAMQPDASARTGSAAPNEVNVPLIGVPFRLGS